MHVSSVSSQSDEDRVTIPVTGRSWSSAPSEGAIEPGGAGKSWLEVHAYTSTSTMNHHGDRWTRREATSAFERAFRPRCTICADGAGAPSRGGGWGVFVGRVTRAARPRLGRAGC